MQSSAEDFRKHYASLSDEALLALRRDELTETAQRCYDDELARRKIAPRGEAPSDDGAEPAPDWLEDAACACSFDVFRGNVPPDAKDARKVLDAAGIPCYPVLREGDPPATGPEGRGVYELMVPGALNLKAVSILDRDFFNPELAAEWKNHLATLSDEDFHALNLDDITAGIADRLERLTKAYKDELSRRSE